jgi:hypothetical protein
MYILTYLHTYLCILEQLSQLKRILADALDWCEQVAIKWNLNKPTHEAASLKEFTIAIVLIQFLQGRSCHWMTVAVL